MKREEIERSFQYNMTDAFIEWDKAVNAEYKEENEEVFYQGAYAAQKYLIEKAREWLKNTLYIHTEIDEDKDWGITNPIDWVTSDYDSVEDFINGFCKAMEE